MESLISEMDDESLCDRIKRSLSYLQLHFQGDWPRQMPIEDGYIQEAKQWMEKMEIEGKEGIDRFVAEGHLQRVQDLHRFVEAGT